MRKELEVKKVSDDSIREDRPFQLNDFHHRQVASATTATCKSIDSLILAIHSVISVLNSALAIRTDPSGLFIILMRCKQLEHDHLRAVLVNLK